MKNKATLFENDKVKILRSPEINFNFSKITGRVEISERNLKKLGFEQLKAGEAQKGDLLCLANKDRDLWAELDGHKSPAVTSFIVFSNRK